MQSPLKSASTRRVGGQLGLWEWGCSTLLHSAHHGRGSCTLHHSPSATSRHFDPGAQTIATNPPCLKGRIAQEHPRDEISPRSFRLRVSKTVAAFPVPIVTWHCYQPREVQYRRLPGSNRASGIFSPLEDGRTTEKACWQSSSWLPHHARICTRQTQRSYCHRHVQQGTSNMLENKRSVHLGKTGASERLVPYTRPFKNV